MRANLTQPFPNAVDRLPRESDALVVSWIMFPVLGKAQEKLGRGARNRFEGVSDAHTWLVDGAVAGIDGTVKGAKAGGGLDARSRYDAGRRH